MTIVTIDFDIIMQPSINFYNEMINGDRPIKNFVDDFSFIANIPADLYIYEYLTRYLARWAKANPNTVYFIEDHGSAVDIIKSFAEREEQIDLVNIDHHHDIGYGFTMAEWKAKSKNYNCANWVKYCWDNQLIRSYNWIHNDNSDMFPTAGRKYITKQSILKNVNFEKDLQDVDAVIVCASYEWVPPMYHPLFLSWNAICSEMNNKHYPIDFA